MRPTPVGPVTIRGITYPTVSEAAYKLGVKDQTIYTAIYRGKLDKVGLQNDHQYLAQVRANRDNNK